MKAALQKIFQQHFEPYAKAHPQPLHKHKAAHAIQDCHTAAMGGHIERCPEGHIERIHYNACHHRTCPQCGALATERWLDKQKARLLDCDHYHAIFTLPHYLIDLWWANPRLMADLLFHTATDTLKILLKDEQFLGAEVGIIPSLHTWGRTMPRHPHLHCLVTGGGWDGKGFKPVTGGYLLPFQVVRKLFRGKYVAGLRKALVEGQLSCPRGQTPQSLEKLFDRLARKVKWNVHIRERYPHGNGVMTYLARYIRGGPIKDQAIFSINDKQVMFGYTDHRDGKKKTFTLAPRQFVQRVLWHMPEPRQHRIRYYGLYHPDPQARAKRAKCREHLDQVPEQDPEPITPEEYLQRIGHPELLCCPICGRPLERVDVQAPQAPKCRPP